MTRTTFSMYCIAVYLVMSAAQIWVTLQATDGKFIYALDDPYIHLAVAENILRGGYGVNFPEVSSPSSSILFPFLLSALLAAGFGDFGPLVLGIGANIVMLCYAGPLLFRFLVSGGSGDGWLFVVIPPLFLVAINAVALPLTGMEHPLHILSVVMIVSGLVRLSETETVPARLGIGVLLGPLIRFEGFAFSVAVIAGLVLARKRRAALVMAGALGAVVLGYMLFTLRLGLPALPSSVLVKSTVTAAAYDSGLLSSVKGVLDNVLWSLDHRWGILFWVGIAFLVPAWLDRSRMPLLAFCAAAMLAGHVAFGRYGWFGRYETYAVAGLILAMIAVHAPALLSAGRWHRVVLVPLILAVLSTSYLKIMQDTPGSSQNVYRQQYQMHRFATDLFPHAVAVNDLGWVSYRNDLYVLDLWGLGSEEARRASSTGQRDAAFLSEITTDKGVVFAMLYDYWFEGVIPESWCRIAAMTTREEGPSRTVSFYIIDKNREPGMRRALQNFEDLLPGGVTLEVNECAAG